MGSAVPISSFIQKRHHPTCTGPPGGQIPLNLFIVSKPHAGGSLHSRLPRSPNQSGRHSIAVAAGADETDRQCTSGSTAPYHKRMLPSLHNLRVLLGKRTPCEGEPPGFFLVARCKDRCTGQNTFGTHPRSEVVGSRLATASARSGRAGREPCAQSMSATVADAAIQHPAPEALVIAKSFACRRRGTGLSTLNNEKERKAG